MSWRRRPRGKGVHSVDDTATILLAEAVQMLFDGHSAETIVKNLGISGMLEFEIGGLIQGTEYDFLNVFGNVTLGGTLDVALFDLGGGEFVPAAGDSFDIITAASIVGEFDSINSPSLSGGLEWFVNYSSTAVELVSTFAGDFDFDGDVDGGDFLEWQRGYGDLYDADDLANWRANYGAVVSLAAASTAVPEPSSIALIAVGLLGMSYRRRKQA